MIGNNRSQTRNAESTRTSILLNFRPSRESSFPRQRKGRCHVDPLQLYSLSCNQAELRIREHLMRRAAAFIAACLWLANRHQNLYSPNKANLTYEDRELASNNWPTNSEDKLIYFSSRIYHGVFKLNCPGKYSEFGNSLNDFQRSGRATRFRNEYRGLKLISCADDVDVFS